MEERTLKEELVSVIIPLYNSAQYITPTLESVLNQTFQNFEIILVDDCSKDNTEEVIRQFAEKDERIKYFRQDKNQGAAVARNRGMDEAQGRYIALLDSDDLWTADKLEKQMAIIRSQNTGFVYCAYDYVDAVGNQIKDKVKIKKIAGYKDLLTKTYISTPTVLIDRERTGDKRMPLRRTGQDYAYWLLLLRETNAYGIDEALVHVRKRPGSLSKNKMQHLRDIYETQTMFEHIHKWKATINVARYIAFTVRKRFF